MLIITPSDIFSRWNGRWGKKGKMVQKFQTGQNLIDFFFRMIEDTTKVTKNYTK